MKNSFGREVKHFALFGFEELQGEARIRMAYAGRRTVVEFLSEPHTKGEKVAILRGACAALEHMHERGVAHLDVKADNVVVEDGGCHARLCDFGMAVRAEGWSGGRKGTRAYTAPEILAGTARDAKAADVWSFAVLAVAVFFLRFPFQEAMPRGAAFRRFAQLQGEGGWGASQALRECYCDAAPLRRDWEEGSKGVVDRSLRVRPEARASMRDLRAVLGEEESTF